MSDEVVKRLLASLDRNAVYVDVNPKRIDSVDKILGKARYTTDLVNCDASYVKVFRSPLPRGKISKIDYTEAQKIQGVTRVISSHDIPGTNRIGFFLPDQPVLCDEDVRYVGDPIVIVVAETPEAAKMAVDAVKCDITPLPGVFSVEEALEDSSPRIHEKGNLVASYHAGYGDCDAGFRKSGVILEGTYKTPYQEHVCLETEAALAIPENKGVTIITCAQGPFAVERAVRTALGGAVEKVRVIVPTVGGAFGGKVESMDEVACVAALAACLTTNLRYSRMTERNLLWPLKNGIRRLSREKSERRRKENCWLWRRTYFLTLEPMHI